MVLMKGLLLLECKWVYFSNFPSRAYNRACFMTVIVTEKDRNKTPKEQNPSGFCSCHLKYKALIKLKI